MSYSSQFEQDVVEGLSASPKRLSSRYFYDDKGTELFRQIMDLEEYYLPECELEILKTKATKISSAFGKQAFDIVELGAGDGSKTVYFLESLLRNGYSVEYYPLDISAAALKINEETVKSRLPDIVVHKIPGDYFQTLSTLDHYRPKLVLFMGSNIGNFNKESGVNFLSLIGKYLKNGEALLLGADLRKNPVTILKAYNDSKGITRAFNLNLLTRINRELNGNFRVDQFDHYPYYDPRAGVTFSYLVSLTAQEVTVAGRTYHFGKNELLHTEISRKYSLDEITELAILSGFADTKHFLDSREYFSVSLMSIKK